MIKIAITDEAYEAIASTMSLGLMAFEQDLSPNGQRHVWLEPNVANRLRAMRGPGETYSDVILALAAIEAQGRPAGRFGRLG